MSAILGITDSTASYGDYSHTHNSETARATDAGSATHAYSAPEPAAGSGDTATFSAEAKALNEPPAADTSTFNGTALTTKLGDGSEIKYSNGGNISWNGKTLNLKGLSGVDPAKDSLAFQASGSFINVYNTATNKGYVLNSDGSQAKNEDGTVKTLTGGYDASQSVLLLNNASSAVAGGSAGDVIINRAAGATITTGGGDDKIFNFAATASVTSGAGNVALYTVGLSGGDINLSGATNAQVTIAKGNMTGGTINLSGGVNTVDAGSISLNGGSISDKAGATTKVTAKAMAGGTLDLKGLADITVNGHVTNKSSITTGNGDDTLKITGNVSGSTIDLGKGKDGATVNGSVSGTVIDLGEGDNALTIGKTAKDLTYKGGADKDDVIVKGAVSNSTIDLGAGVNAFTAKNDKNVAQKLTDVTITAVDGADSEGAALAGATTITAGAYRATKAGIGISLGNGANSISLGAVSGYAKAANPTERTSFSMGAGNDTVTVAGAMSNIDLDLGAGLNGLSAEKKGKRQTLTNVKISAEDLLEDDGSVDKAGAASIYAGAYKATTGGMGISLGTGQMQPDTTGTANLVALGTVTGYKQKDGETGLGTYINMGLGGTGKQDLEFAGSASNINVTLGGGNDDVMIFGAVKDSTFDLGAGNNGFQATKGHGNARQTLTNVNIKASQSTAEGAAAQVTTIIAGAYKATRGGISIDLGGVGSNTVSLTSISGFAKAEAGDETAVRFGAGDDHIVVSGAAKNANIDLGAGANSFAAAKTKGDKTVGQTLTNVNITAHDGKDSEGAAVLGSATVIAGAYKATRAGVGMELGSGANAVTLKSFSGKAYKDDDGKEATTTISLGAGAAKSVDQVLTIGGSAKNLNYVGGLGADSVTVNGTITDSSFDLGAGTNYLGAYKENKNGTKAGKAMNGVRITADSGAAEMTTIETSGVKAGKSGTASSLALGARHTLNIGKVVTGSASAGKAEP